MQGFLIDPETRTIEAVEYSGDYHQIYKLLGIELFTTVTLNEAGDVVYVDDEGLLHDPTFFFTLKDYPQPLAGKGLVLGTDEEGETVAAKGVTLEWLKANVGFKRLAVDGFTSWEGEQEHPTFGKVWTIGHAPVLREREYCEECGSEAPAHDGNCPNYKETE